MKPAQAVIFAGGRGERLRPLTDTLPKPMIDVNDKPFVSYLLAQCAAQGIKRVLLLTGYRGDQIERYFGDGAGFGYEVTYHHGAVEWETGKRLYEARELLDEAFFLLYSDNFTQYRLDEIYALHSSSRAILTLLAAKKTPGNLGINSAGRISVYDPQRKTPGLELVDIGFMVVERKGLLPVLQEGRESSFAETLRQLAMNGTAAGLVSEHPYYSVSDPKRLETARRHLEPKRIVLLDRDGTLNRKMPRGQYITKIGQIEFLPGVIEGLRLLTDAGYSFIIISNQAGIATGDLSEPQLQEINAFIECELKGYGINIRRSYCCGAHWQDHDNPRRKPAPGMFIEAGIDYNFRLDECYYIGDDPRDMIAAYNACARGIYVGQASVLSDLEPKYQPIFVGSSLVEAAQFILEHP